MLAGRTVLLTGATGEIGREIAHLTALAGAQLALLDLAPDRVEALACSLTGGPHRTLASALDTPRACTEAVAAADGPLYAIVHMAGVFCPTQSRRRRARSTTAPSPPT